MGIKAPDKPDNAKENILGNILEGEWEISPPAAQPAGAGGPSRPGGGLPGAPEHNAGGEMPTAALQPELVEVLQKYVRHYDNYLLKLPAWESEKYHLSPAALRPYLPYLRFRENLSLVSGPVPRGVVLSLLRETTPEYQRLLETDLAASVPDTIDVYGEKPLGNSLAAVGITLPAQKDLVNLAKVSEKVTLIPDFGTLSEFMAHGGKFLRCLRSNGIDEHAGPVYLLEWRGRPDSYVSALVYDRPKTNRLAALALTSEMLVEYVRKNSDNQVLQMVEEYESFRQASLEENPLKFRIKYYAAIQGSHPEMCAGLQRGVLCEGVLDNMHGGAP